MAKAEVERRMARADELLKQSAPRGAIVTVMAAEFSAAPRTVDDYLARVRRRWETDNASTAEVERERAVQRLERLAHKFEDKEAWGALVNVERLLIELRGLRAAPPVVEVAPPPPPDVAPDEAVAAVILALEAIARVIQLEPEAWASEQAVRALRAALASAARSLDANRGPSGLRARPYGQARRPGDGPD
ncbi:hypothetical protein BH11MYX4_BH11MYX4_22520 [soil metagenome]